MSSKSYLFIGNSSGSIAVFRGPIIKYYIKKGQRCVVICPDGEYIKSIENLGAKIYTTSIKREGSFKELIKVIQLIISVVNKENINIIFSFSHLANFSTIVANIFVSKKIILTITGLGKLWNINKFHFRVKRSLIRIIYKFAELKNYSLIFQNKTDELELFNREKNKHKITPGSGIDFKNNFDQKKYKKQQNELLNVVLVSKALFEKKVELFYETSKLAHKRKLNINFHHFGNGVNSSSGITNQELKVLSKECNVNFYGRITNVIERLKTMDLIVSCSIREGMPRSLIEALANDLFIVGVDAPGVRDVIIESDTGLIVENSPQKILEGILSYFERFVPGTAYNAALTKFEIKNVIDVYEKTIKLYNL